VTHVTRHAVIYRLSQRLKWWCRRRRMERLWDKVDCINITHAMQPPFDWLEEYGPYWKPGSLAFWLEPRTEADLRAWLRKYQPQFEGEIEVGKIKVSTKRLIYDPYSVMWHQINAIHLQSQLQAYANYNAQQNGLANQGYLNQRGLGVFPLGSPLGGIF